MITRFNDDIFQIWCNECEEWIDIGEVYLHSDKRLYHILHILIEEEPYCLLGYQWDIPEEVQRQMGWI